MKVLLCFLACVFLSTSLASAQTFSYLYSRVPNGIPDGTIWMATDDGSSDLQISVGEWPRLSRDGTKMVFHRGSNPELSRRDLWVADFTTGDEMRVFSNPDYAVSYDWTADSSQIVFDFTCGIYIMNSDGSSQRQLIGVDCYDDAPRLSPVDGTIVFHNLHFGLFLADPDGRNRRLIPNTRPNDLYPQWSPDAQWISFARANGDVLLNYLMIRPDGTELTQLTFFLPVEASLGQVGQWTPDQSAVLAPVTTADGNGIYAIATDGSGTLTPLPISPGDDATWMGSIIPL